MLFSLHQPPSLQTFSIHQTYCFSIASLFMPLLVYSIILLGSKKFDRIMACPENASFINLSQSAWYPIKDRDEGVLPRKDQICYSSLSIPLVSTKLEVAKLHHLIKGSPQASSNVLGTLTRSKSKWTDITIIQFLRIIWFDAKHLLHCSVHRLFAEQSEDAIYVLKGGSQEYFKIVLWWNPWKYQAETCWD